jgi:iron complex outermembrane recepter protein
MKKKNLLVISAAGALALSSSPGNADQPTTADQPVEEVTVTGTHLGQGLTSYTPISTVSEKQLAQLGTVNIEEFLNDMPQIAAGENNTSNFPGNGTASIDLRGFGSNRTLVLVDGRRFVPTNENGTVDVSAIPAALVKRVDLVTGGASAIYGSDAITGVVNFVLNNDFEGFQLDADYKKTVPYLDGTTYSADLLAGTKFADGRGHMTVYANYTDRAPILEAARPYTDVVYNDGTINGVPSLVLGGSSLVPGTRVVLPAAVIPKTLPGYSQSTLAVNSITFDSNGSPLAFENPQNLYNYGPPSYLQVPYNRFETHLSADYTLFPSADGYIAATYMRQNSDTNAAPAPISISSINNVLFDYADNPYLSPQAKSIFSAAAAKTNPAGVPAGDYLIQSLGSRLPSTLPRIQFYNRDTYQVTAGVKGDLFTSGWTYDTYYQQGVATTTEQNDNQINPNSFYQALNATTGANGQPACIVATGGCAPLNIWGPGNISQAAFKYVLVGYDSIANYMFKNAALNVNGALPEKISLNAGPIATAVGVEWRNENFQSQPDSGTLINNIPVPPTNGSYDVTEYYGEINVPLLKDFILAKSLNVRGALRRSDYSTIGDVTTYSWGGEWTLPFVDWITIRGGKQRAIRAPNILELYAPNQGSGLITFSDPCDKRTGLLQTAAQQGFCNAWGAPTGFQEANVSVNATQESNPNLQAETADSYTVGTVILPPLFTEFLNAFSFTVDYYNIKLANAIAPFGGGVANNITSCFFAMSLSSPFCGNVTRDSLGNINPIISPLTNVSLKWTAGIDGEVAASVDMNKFNSHLPGKLSVSFLSNYQPRNGFQASTALPFVNCAGYFGPPCGAEITGSGTPKLRTSTTLNWTDNAYSLTARWRWIDGMKDARFTQAQALDLTATLQSLVNTIPPKAQTTPNVSYVDVSASWQFDKTLLVTVGCNNLFNLSPPLLGNQQVQDNTEPDTYDPVGRSVWANIRLNF